MAGCLTQRYPEEIRHGAARGGRHAGHRQLYRCGHRRGGADGRGERPEHFGGIDRAYDDGERMVTTPPYTAYLKIAEGCSNGCAFCIIPKLRGRYRSRSMEALLAEARGLADSGVKELIVIAQDITRYGLDWKDGSYPGQAC